MICKQGLLSNSRLSQVARIIPLLSLSALVLGVGGCKSSSQKKVSKQDPVSSDRERIRDSESVIEQIPMPVVDVAHKTAPRPAPDLPKQIIRGLTDEEIKAIYLSARPAPRPIVEVKPVQSEPATRIEHVAIGPGWDVPIRNKWNYIVIHHSASPRGSASAFHQEHLRRGWDGLGYHFVIGNGTGSGDGEVEVGYRWKQQIRGAHAGNNDYNYHGIGVCLVGNFETDVPNKRQMASLYALVRFLQGKNGISTDQIIGHQDVPGKDTQCPGKNFSVQSFKSMLRGGKGSVYGPQVVIGRASAPNGIALGSAGFP